MNLPPLPGFHQAYRHVCMMEGPDPELRLSTIGYDTLLQESKRQADELQRLKFLLRKHNIEPDTSLPATIKYVSKNAIHKEFDGLTPSDRPKFCYASSDMP